MQGQIISVTTTLLSDPTQKGSFQKISTRYYTQFSSLPIQVYLPSDISYHYGQRVEIIGSIIVKNTNGQSVVSIFKPTIKVIPNEFGFLLALAYSFRQRLSQLYESLLPQTEAGLLLGIVLGVKVTMTKSFMTNLQSVGVVHVIAASGMNVTMVAEFLQSLLSRFFGRKYVLLISIAAISFYALVSGLQASILRASIMTILVFSAQLIGRQYTAFYSLGVTSWVMLLLQPELVSDIGFQLSILSTLGILMIKPLVPEGILNDDVGTTIASQLATLPILLINFGQYGLLSILVNGLVLWTIPILMVLGGIGGLIGLLIPVAGQLLILLCLPLLAFFIFIVNFFGSLQWNLSIKNFSVIGIFGYYFVLISGVIFIKINNRKRAILVNESKN